MEQFGQTSKSVQRPSKTGLYFLVPFNILTAMSIFLALPCRLMAVALATWPNAPFPTICFIVTCSLGGSQEHVYGLREAYSLICSMLSGLASAITCEWVLSSMQCHVMTLRRFRKFNCNLKDKIVFDSIKADKLLNLLGNYFKSSNQLSYEK